MIRHYIVSAFRQIAKSKGLFAANVFGFTLNSHGGLPGSGISRTYVPFSFHAGQRFFECER